MFLQTLIHFSHSTAVLVGCKAPPKRLVYFIQSGVCVQIDKLASEALGCEQGALRLRCQHGSQFHCARNQLFARIHVVDQPDAKSLVGGNVFSGHRQLFRPRQPDRFVQRMNDLSETYIDLRLAEDRFLRRKPDVAERRRSEEHTSELQSLAYLVCRLLLEKKKLHGKTSRALQEKISSTRT